MAVRVGFTIAGGSGGTSAIGVTGTVSGSVLERLQGVRGVVWRQWRSHCHSGQCSKDYRGETHGY